MTIVMSLKSIVACTANTAGKSTVTHNTTPVLKSAHILSTGNGLLDPE